MQSVRGNRAANLVETFFGIAATKTLRQRFVPGAVSSPLAVRREAGRDRRIGSHGVRQALHEGVRTQSCMMSRSELPRRRDEPINLRAALERLLATLEDATDVSLRHSGVN